MGHQQFIGQRMIIGADELYWYTLPLSSPILSDTSNLCHRHPHGRVEEIDNLPEELYAGRHVTEEEEKISEEEDQNARSELALQLQAERDKLEERLRKEADEKAAKKMKERVKKRLGRRAVVVDDGEKASRKGGGSSG